MKKVYLCTVIIILFFSCNYTKRKSNQEKIYTTDVMKKDTIFRYEFFCDENCTDKLCQHWKAPHKDSVLQIIKRLKPIDGRTWHYCYGHFQCGVKGIIRYNDSLYNYHLNAGGWLNLSSESGSKFYGSMDKKDTINNFISVYYCDDMLNE